MDDCIPKKPCSKCGVEKPLSEFHRQSNSPDGHKPACKMCRCAETRQYVSTHPDKVKATSKKWAQNNREKRNTSSRKYAQNHPEKVKATKLKSRIKHADEITAKRRSPEQKQRKQKYDKERYEKNPEVVRIRATQWRILNPERAKQSDRAKRLAHPDKVRAYGQAARARRRNAEGIHTAADVRLQYKSQKGLCWWCGCKLADEYHVDHRIALDKGGTNWPSNLCISCPTCNLRKNNRMPWEFNGRLL